METNNFDSLEKYLNSDPSLLKRHTNSRPPREAYLYIPAGIDLVEFNAKNPTKTLRRIFEYKIEKNLEYEESMLNQLESEIKNYNQVNKDKKLLFPFWYRDSDKLRFLQATCYKHTDSIKLMIENIEWRTNLIPPVVNNKVFEILNCGFIYVHGRDCKFRPIIVLDLDYYTKYKKIFSYTDWLITIIFFMEYMINNQLIPGQIENWNIITNLGGVSIISIPSEVKSLLKVLQSNYRCRLYVNFIFGLGFLMKGVWSIIKGMLDETTQKKLKVVSPDQKKEIFAFINEEQIEKRFGGKAPNVNPESSKIFPPICPSHNYKAESGPNVTLISEKEYKILYKENKLSAVNEDFLNKWTEEENLEKLKIFEETKKINEEIIKKQEEEKVEKLKENANYKSGINSQDDSMDNEFTPTIKNKLKNMNKSFNRKTQSKMAVIKLSNMISKSPDLISNNKSIRIESDNNESFFDNTRSNFIKPVLVLEENKEIILENQQESTYCSAEKICVIF